MATNLSLKKNYFFLSYEKGKETFLFTSYIRNKTTKYDNIEPRFKIFHFFLMYVYKIFFLTNIFNTYGLICMYNIYIYIIFICKS